MGWKNIIPRLTHGKEPVGRLDMSHQRARYDLSPFLRLQLRKRMKQYAEEFKSSIIVKMLPPNNMPVPELARETGITKDYTNEDVRHSIRLTGKRELSNMYNYAISLVGHPL